MADKKQSLYDRIKESGKNPIQALCEIIESGKLPEAPKDEKPKSK